jgi:hypothetical protein
MQCPRWELAGNQHLILTAWLWHCWICTFTPPHCSSPVPGIKLPGGPAAPVPTGMSMSFDLTPAGWGVWWGQPCRHQPHPAPHLMHSQPCGAHHWPHLPCGQSNQGQCQDGGGHCHVRGVHSAAGQVSTDRVSSTVHLPSVMLYVHGPVAGMGPKAPFAITCLLPPGLGCQWYGAQRAAKLQQPNTPGEQADQQALARHVPLHDNDVQAWCWQDDSHPRGVTHAGG